MSKRRQPSLETKLAAALLTLGDVPYEHAKQMSARQICSLYHFDHGILHAVDPIDEAWNLTPRLIAAHREKSKRDTATVAKIARIRGETRAGPRKTIPCRPFPKASRKLQSRGFEKRP
jgi:hypothetical protein